MFLSFHNVHGRNVSISSNGKRATRFDGYSDGIVFSKTPIPSACAFRIVVLKVCTSWIGDLKIGLSTIDPSRMKNKVPISLSSDDSKEIWSIPIHRNLSKNSVINVHTINGMIYVDGKALSQKIHRNSWLTIDLYGPIVSICLEELSMDNNRSPPSPFMVNFHSFKGPGLRLSSDFMEAIGTGLNAYAFSSFTIKQKQSLTLISGGGTLEAVLLTTCNPDYLTTKTIPSRSLDSFCERSEDWTLCRLSKRMEAGTSLKLLFNSDGRIEFYINGVLDCVLFEVDPTLSYWLGLDLTPDGTVILRKLKNECDQMKSDENVNQSSFNTPNKYCIICLEAEVNAAFIPCGHLALCITCAQEIIIQHGTCPVCRTAIQDMLKIFT